MMWIVFLRQNLIDRDKASEKLVKAKLSLGLGFRVPKRLLIKNVKRLKHVVKKGRVKNLGFLKRGVLCFSLWRSVICWRTKELLTKWLTFVCTLIYSEIYYAQCQFSIWMISLLWKSSMPSDHLPRLCTSCAILMPCSLSSRNRPDGSSFIINSRHQLVFCVDRD